MEPLLRSIPLGLKNMIMSTDVSDLRSSCAALDLHFSTSLLFGQLLEQLVNTFQSSCAKDASVTLKSKLDGNTALKISKHAEALSAYTKALRFAPYSSKEEDKLLLATVFVNRASILHKLKQYEAALRDCGRAIDVYPSYSKAWYRRSRIKFDVNNLEGAVVDMKEALLHEKTGSGLKQIENEIAFMETKLTTRSLPSDITTQLDLELKTIQREGLPDVQRLRLHWSDERGWDLYTTEQLDIGSLIFQEQAYAAIVLKSNRDTHCHYCFEVLPVDPVGCCRCAIPMYCSESCRDQATAMPVTQSLNLDENHKSEVKISESPPVKVHGEHIHECGGCAWSAVLPTEAVLAARILFRITQRAGILDNDRSPKVPGDTPCTEDRSDRQYYLTRIRMIDSLCSNFDKLSSNDKLEMHVLGVIVAHCIQQSSNSFMVYGTKSAAEVASKLVLLIAQTRVNAMAIYRMSSPEEDLNSTAGMAFCTVEQVKVAQGLFLLGSSLNHSCVPNVHASFKLRCLFIQSVSTISAGSSLELCYGPQVGHMSHMERKNTLQERYSFTCKCSACARVSSSDLFLRSFRCTKQGCMGVVLRPDLCDFHLTYSERLPPAVDEEFISEEHGCGDSSFGNFSKLPRVYPGSCDQSLGRTCVSEKDFQAFTYTYVQKDAVPDTDFIESEFTKLMARYKTDGRCPDCGSPVDVETAQEIANTALSQLQSIESKMLLLEGQVGNLSQSLDVALVALGKLRTVVHAYNEQLAKAEDIVARLLCFLDQPASGLRHCQNAIEILEHLYSKHHIVLGNEYLKLASVALTVPDNDCAKRSLRSAEYIFRVHYGSDYLQSLPYLKEIHRMLSED
ncbi:SET and MYND domain-containing protein 4 [Marchantia polymorpha subsp. ruderalis]|nr:hypothetical protein MARPO_0086s0022 [Marchantia polymorpha]BBN10990.1 hypothetical protein Mp_5g08180 [Marchantia polymorpha subsp. ruderalis]|eukprot:PTQ33688.1 hypothetical protein MARPO_0086s0022 [Marchantia polymorpha]